MKIAILSDTHDHVENTKLAIKRALEKKASMFIHAGDLCSPFMIKLFKGLKLHVVKGNNDADIFRIMNLLEENQTLHDELLTLEIDKVKLAVYHGTTDEITTALQKDNYDILITGHTHQKLENFFKKTLHLNPGSVHGFENKGSFIILDLPTKKYEFVEL